MLLSNVLRGLMTFALISTVALAGAARADQHEDEGNGIVAPSEYLEDIESPGDTGGVMDEVDAGEAQAEAAEAAAKKTADPKKAEDDDVGGW